MSHDNTTQKKDIIKNLTVALQREVQPGRTYQFMEFCGGHTHSIFYFGINGILPGEIRMVHGPGCPVCVLPMGRLDMAIHLALEEQVILCSYGDMLRVPGSGGKSLLDARAQGADVRMVYSISNALELARENPDRQVVFFAIGFETTTPPTAVAVKQAAAAGVKNFSIFCNHMLTPSAIQNILESKEIRELGTVRLDGFIGPGHVSAVIGSQPFEYFAEEYQKPVLIAGFEPLDLLAALLMLVRQANEGRYEVENAYPHVVTREGNVKAKKLVAELFELVKVFEWRGLGAIPYSALRLKAGYRDFDAETRFHMPPLSSPDHKGCDCSSVLRGLKLPTECKLFAKGCSPEKPIGPCMVSPEGACAAYYRYASRITGESPDNS